MNGFTSGKTSHDPQPWAFCSSGVFGVRSARDGGRSGLMGWEWVYDPRPEFDNHNPILVAFRSQPDIDLWDMGFAMFTTFGGYKDWEKDHHYFQCFTVATDHQIAHARRVLAKYAAVFL